MNVVTIIIALAHSVNPLKQNKNYISFYFCIRFNPYSMITLIAILLKMSRKRESVILRMHYLHAKITHHQTVSDICYPCQTPQAYQTITNLETQEIVISRHEGRTDKPVQTLDLQQAPRRPNPR